MEKLYKNKCYLCFKDGDKVIYKTNNVLFESFAPSEIQENESLLNLSILGKPLKATLTLTRESSDDLFYSVNGRYPKEVSGYIPISSRYHVISNDKFNDAINDIMLRDKVFSDYMFIPDSIKEKIFEKIKDGQEENIEQIRKNLIVYGRRNR